MKSYSKSIMLLFCLLVLGVINSQTKEANLILTDGTEFEGYGEIKINSFTKSKKILFRMDLEDKPDVWRSDQVKRIEFDNGFQIVAYEYVKAGKYSPQLYRVVEPGFMTLYANDDVYYSSNQDIGNGLKSGGQKYSTTSLYIKREDKNLLYVVGKNKNSWKKKLIECFGDCKEVMNIITGKDLKDYDIEDLVWNFNEYCSGN